MTGKRLVVGAVAMGVIVPSILFFLLPLQSPRQILVVSVTCFLTWGVADLVALILSRPRLENRSPSDALRSWEPQQRPQVEQDAEVLADRMSGQDSGA